MRHDLNKWIGEIEENIYCIRYFNSIYICYGDLKLDDDDYYIVKTGYTSLNGDIASKYFNMPFYNENITYGQNISSIQDSQLHNLLNMLRYYIINGKVSKANA